MKLPALMVLALLTSGCAFERDLSMTLRNNVGIMKTMSVHTKGTPRTGSLIAQASDGETFTGTYSALVPGVERGIGGGYQPNSFSSSLANVHSMAMGDKGTSLECEFTSNRHLIYAAGQGRCWDQYEVWSMMFVTKQ